MWKDAGSCLTVAYIGASFRRPCPRSLAGGGGSCRRPRPVVAAINKNTCPARLTASTGRANKARRSGLIGLPSAVFSLAWLDKNSICPSVGRPARRFCYLPPLRQTACLITPLNIKPRREQNSDNSLRKSQVQKPLHQLAIGCQCVCEQRADIGQRHPGRVSLSHQAIIGRRTQRWGCPIVDNRPPEPASKTTVMVGTFQKTMDESFDGDKSKSVSPSAGNGSDSCSSENIRERTKRVAALHVEDRRVEMRPTISGRYIGLLPSRQRALRLEALRLVPLFSLESVLDHSHSLDCIPPHILITGALPGNCDTQAGMLSPLPPFSILFLFHAPPTRTLSARRVLSVEVVRREAYTCQLSSFLLGRVCDLGVLFLISCRKPHAPCSGREGCWKQSDTPCAGQCKATPEVTRPFVKGVAHPSTSFGEKSINPRWRVGIRFKPLQCVECVLCDQGAATTRLPPRRSGVDFQRGHSLIFACGNRTRRFLWPAGFLGVFSFPSTFHSGVAPYSPLFANIGSQDLEVKSRPDLSTPYSTVRSRRRLEFLPPPPSKMLYPFWLITVARDTSDGRRAGRKGGRVTSQARVLFAGDAARSHVTVPTAAPGNTIRRSQRADILVGVDAPLPRRVCGPRASHHPLTRSRAAALARLPARARKDNSSCEPLAGRCLGNPMRNFVVRFATLLNCRRFGESSAINCIQIREAETGMEWTVACCKELSGHSRSMISENCWKPKSGWSDREPNPGLLPNLSSNFKWLRSEVKSFERLFSASS
ncbi:hypothetical protein PR048_018515 [Dryococelus australis]|uniref:Uncharacterized protein n=1 Tax=Dryococelus australis TaxID=614101 RepID=A0ABQ9HCH5_9NEOP|nr:hypothetical protein PR048_018515 [Dryococelus australis]